MREYLRAALQPAQLGIAFLSISAGVTVLQLRPWLIGTAKKSEATVDYAGRAAKHIDKVAGISEDAASRERDFLRDYLPKLAGESEALLGSARLSIESLTRTSEGLNDSQHRITDATVGTLNQAKRNLRGLQPTEKEIADTIPYIRKSVTDIDALALNQDIPKTLHNVQETTGNVDGTAKDVQQAVHAYLHPTLPKRIWGWVEGTGLDVAKFFIP